MAKALWLLCGVIAAFACGGGPTSPDGGAAAAQSLLDRSTPDIKVNGVTVPPGPTIIVTVGTKIDWVITSSNNSGQFLHTAVAAVRDDGVERIDQCGASGSGGQGGAFGSGTTIFANDPLYTRGHTVRLMLLGALSSSSGSGPGSCLLGVLSGAITHANVQAERLLATFAVQ